MHRFYSTYKGPIAALIFFVVAGGFYSLVRLKVELFPDITFPKIKIIVENGEQPVDKMLVTTTIPIEEAIKKVEDLKLVRSLTSRGSCEISAFLDWNSNVDLGKQRTEARINAIKSLLPAGVIITVEKMNPSILPIMGFSLEGKSFSQIELRQIAEYTVKPLLSRIEGISEIAVIGGKVKEFQVSLNPYQLSRLGLTSQNVIDALSKSNFIESAGFIQDYHRLYLSVTDAALKNKTDIENFVVGNTPKRYVRVRDIAEVDIAERRDYIKINANGNNVPLVAILKQPQANLIQVENSIKASLNELRSILPKGVTLRPYYNQADFVKDSIASLRDVMWIGLLLGTIVTVLFLRSLKASITLLLTIPVTLGLSFTVLYGLGYSFNIMTIGAIAAAIGLIIDDAIIIVEQIHRSHEEHPEQDNLEIVTKAIKYLLPSMIGSSLSTIVIFLPFVLMSGVAGAYFKVMTNTMIITLVCSYFSTWIGLPVLYIILSKEHTVLHHVYKEVKTREWVYYAIQRPAISLSLIAVLVIAAAAIIPNLQSGFLPEMDEGSIVLDYFTPPGTSLDDTDAMLKQVDKILIENPEVESFSRRTGTQMGFFITEPNTGDYLIQLKKGRSKTTEEISNDIRIYIESMLPAMRVDFGQVIGDMLGDLMSSIQPIEVKIFGDDQTKLEAYADTVAAIVERTQGTADVFNGITIAGPTVMFEPDMARLALYQISPQDFHFQMETKLDGVVAGKVLEKNRQVDIRLFEKGFARSVSELRRTSIFMPNAKLKPIEEFAVIHPTSGVAEISRENLKPFIAVTARLNNRDLGRTLADIRKTLEERLRLPFGYQIIYGGAYAEQQRAFSELLTILFLSSFLVFAVILFLFRKIKIAFIIMFIAMLGISGSLIALFVTSTALNVGSYIGMIMIVGIIGENAIFTYQQYRDAKAGGRRIDEALVFAISTRLRPKLMTALGAISALFPLALGIGTGAQMHQPLAIAIIGGLIFALPLLLVVFPSLLRLLDKE
jgi:CzcA family heavy metal efflux pump